MARPAPITRPGRSKTKKALYTQVSSDLRHQDGVVFMNYGFLGDGADAPRLLPEDEPVRASIQLYHHVAAAVPLKNKDVLEVGCGRGGGASYVARYLHPRTLVAVDFVPGLIDMCSRVHGGITNLRFQVADAEDLPFADRSFHAVLNVESAHCYERPGEFFQTVFRVLRPRGHFLFADFCAAADTELFEAELADAGFLTTSKRNITPQVIAALDDNGPRLRAFLAAKLPWHLWAEYGEFAAMPGSTTYQRYASGEWQYFSYVLQKPAAATRRKNANPTQA